MLSPTLSCKHGFGLLHIGLDGVGVVGVGAGVVGIGAGVGVVGVGVGVGVGVVGVGVGTGVGDTGLHNWSLFPLYLV